MLKNKLKKLISTMVIAIMVIVNLPLNVFADDFPPVTYSFNETTGELVISGTGPMNDFSTIHPSPWYFHNIPSVKIEDGITRIGKCAFCDCRGLISITVPDGVKEIGRMAFAGCRNLNSVTIGKCVKKIDGLAFWECKNLTSVTYLGKTDPECDDAFEDCIQLKEVYVPSDYEGRFFCGIKVNKGNEEVSSTQVSESDNSSLSQISEEFEEMHESQVSSQESESNSYNSNIKCSFDTDTGELKIFGAGEMEANNRTNLRYPWTKYTENIKSVNIEKGINNIGSWAFNSCKNLRSITIPDSVTSIEDNAFTGCENLNIIYLGATDPLHSPEEYKVSFFDRLILGDGGGMWHDPSVNRGYAFYLAFNIKVTVPLYYKDNSFCAIPVTKDKVAMPSKLSGNCGKNIKYEFDVPKGELEIFGVGEMDNYMYWPKVCNISPWDSYKSYIESIKIENGVTKIGNSAFYDCKNLLSITIPNSTIQIGDFAFSGCTSLMSLNIPKGVKRIGDSAFYGCKGLKDVKLPGSINFIDHHSFACCTNLNSVTFCGNSQPEIGSFRLRHPVFVKCPNLKEINVPSAYTKGTFCGVKVNK